MKQKSLEPKLNFEDFKAKVMECDISPEGVANLAFKKACNDFRELLDSFQVEWPEQENLTFELNPSEETLIEIIILYSRQLKKEGEEEKVEDNTMTLIKDHYFQNYGNCYTFLLEEFRSPGFSKDFFAKKRLRNYKNK